MTLGLSLITNNYENAKRVIDTYSGRFDKVYITVGDKDKRVYNQLKGYEASPESKIQVSYFKWTDDFAAARNFNLKQIKTDFWFWLDDDDDIVNPERLPDLLKVAVENDVDVVQLKYDYAQNANGEAISDHWRERLIRRSYEGKWDAPVHETFQGPPAVWEQSDWVVVRHDKAKIDNEKSLIRNARILSKHWADTKDPRDAFYLGMTAMGTQKHQEAITWFLRHIEASGSDEDKYRSWCRIAECEWIRQKHEQALYATDEAVKLKPHFPDAYFIKVLILTVSEKYDDAIEWLKVAVSKPQPETMHMVDPTLYEYRGLANGAQCYLFSGKVREAHKIYQIVKQKNPKFWEELSENDDVDWESVFEEAYFDQKAIDSIKWLLQYTKGNGGKPTKLFESLPARIFSDLRLSPDRANFLPAKTWPSKSIVFYCGQGTEAWGPDTLDKGMGGSEEAIVYLSRELAKLGWQVTVYNEREDEYKDVAFGGEWARTVIDYPDWQVTYKPWTLFNPSDEFDVFVGWRMPGLTRNIKARIRAVDMHDMPYGHAAPTNATIEHTDKFFFKSKYHAKQSKVPKAKQVIIGNGIKGSQFDETL